MVSTNATVPGGTEEQSTSVRETQRRLQGAERLWTFGSLEGPEPTQWAFISDIDTDPSGQIYVLDRGRVEVKILASDGSLLTSILREGDGPLEMRAPTGLELARDDTLIVHSPTQVRFLAMSPDGFRYARSFLSNRGIDGLCASGSRLHLRVASSRGEGIVQSVDPEGEELAVFGDAYEHESAAVRAALSRGLIACSADGRRVVTAMYDGPLIYGHSETGAELWVAYLEDFQMPTVIPVGVDAQTGVRRPRDRANDRVLALTSLPNHMFLVQVARIGAPQTENGRSVRPVHRLDGYVLSGDTGRGTYVGSDLPLVHHATSNRLYGSRQDPDLGYLVLEAFRW